ncbi:MAG: hypothetical protein J1F32_06815 [Erysipelotrichales bacterium]|nr:hypothetical protein [Erysipelotrichales bacterium]
MKKISKVCCLFMCTCLSACGDINSTFQPTKNVTNLLKTANNPIEINNEKIETADFKGFLSKFTDFSLRFNDSFMKKYDDKSTNSAVSPLSLFFALAMTSECTANNSKEEILNALNMTGSELKNNLPILYALENSTTYSYDDMEGKEVISSIKDLNNSIWLSKRLNKSEDTLNALANYYYADSYESDFLYKNEAANKDFRQYIKDKTRGLIDRNFDIDANTLLILLNTLYLKDIWSKSTDKLSFTNDTYDFINRNKSVTKSKLLKGKYIKGRALHTDTYSSFFTTTENGLRIYFILPNNSNLENVFIKENIDQITNFDYNNENLDADYFTSTYFPKFEASSDEDLVELLNDDFKIHDIFNSSKADFSSISSDDMYVKQVIHSTKLKVDEKGIEGVAITAIMAPESAGPSEREIIYEEFIIDKAFGYVLTDKYGVTLFSGIVNKI